MSIFIESRNEVTWIPKVEIDHTCGVLQVTSSKSQCQSKIKLATIMKSKEVKWQDSILMQAQVEEVIFIFLKYRNIVLLRGV
jgi:hypothetical protein